MAPPLSDHTFSQSMSPTCRVTTKDRCNLESDLIAIVFILVNKRIMDLSQSKGGRC